MAGHVATDINSHRKSCNVSGCSFNVYGKGCIFSAKALRTDSKLVYFAKQLCLKFLIIRVGA